MPFLQTIGLQNFRLFKDKTQFELAPITILTGTNSSGKSSLIKSLLLLRSSIKETGGIGNLSFSGAGHNLGWFGQTLNSESEETEMTFTLNFPFEAFPKKTLIDLTYSGESRKSLSGNLKKIKIYLESGEALFDMELNAKGRKGEYGNNEKDKANNSLSSHPIYTIKSDLITFLSFIQKGFGKHWTISNFKNKYNDENYEKADSEFIDFLNKNGHIYEHTHANIFREFYFRNYDNSDLNGLREKIENWDNEDPINLVFENYSR